jgi:endoglucanase
MKNSLKYPPVDEEASLRALEGILREPTAPYFERRVRGAIRKALEGAGIPCRRDASGNLVARYRRGKGRPVAFTAHMDHPGFEVLEVYGRKAKARWNGQVPVFDLRGLKLALYDEDGARFGSARVLKGDGRHPGPKTPELLLEVPEGARSGFFGHADLVPFELKGDLIRAKALDDNAGCGTIVAALLHLAKHRVAADVLAVFTRAEEGGFKGAFAAVENKTIPKGRPVIVLECSKAIAGVAQGGGPAVRVGDKACVFDPDLATACGDAASALATVRKGFRWQRKLMDGGTCEATVYCLAGYRALCLALPLGNYHNNGEKGVEPETIDRRDFVGAVELLCAFAAAGLDPAGARRGLTERLWKRFLPAERRRLKDTR